MGGSTYIGEEGGMMVSRVAIGRPNNGVGELIMQPAGGILVIVMPLSIARGASEGLLCSFVLSAQWPSICSSSEGVVFVGGVALESSVLTFLRRLRFFRLIDLSLCFTQQSQTSSAQSL